MAKNPKNQTRQEMGRNEFLKNVQKWKKQSGDTIINQLKRLGASCDWERTAFTMSGAPGSPAEDSGNFHDAVIKVFVEMYNKGLIYRGKRLVNWDIQKQKISKLPEKCGILNTHFKIMKLIFISSAMLTVIS